MFVNLILILVLCLGIGPITYLTVTLFREMMTKTALFFYVIAQLSVWSLASCSLYIIERSMHIDLPTLEVAVSLHVLYTVFLIHKLRGDIWNGFLKKIKRVQQQVDAVSISENDSTEHVL